MTGKLESITNKRWLFVITFLAGVIVGILIPGIYHSIDKPGNSKILKEKQMKMDLKKYAKEKSEKEIEELDKFIEKLRDEVDKVRFYTYERIINGNIPTQAELAQWGSYDSKLEEYKFDNKEFIKLIEEYKWQLSLNYDYIQEYFKRFDKPIEGMNPQRKLEDTAVLRKLNKRIN